MRHLVFRAMAERRRSAMWLTIGLLLLTVWVAAVFPIIRDSTAFQGFLERFPPEMAAIFGIDPATFNTGAGYLQAQLFSLFGPMMIVTFAVEGALRATTREESDGTIDTLLAAPITRRQLLMGRFGATVLLSAVVCASLAIGILVSDPIFGLSLTVEAVVATNTGLWLLGLVFGGVALLTGAVTGRASVSRGLAYGLALTSLLVTGFAQIYDWLLGPARFSPFTWYEGENPLITGWYADQARLVVMVAALMVIAVFAFDRRDVGTNRPIELVARLRPRRRAHVRMPRSSYLLRDVMRETLWDRRRSVWAWTLAVAVMLLVTFTAWPTISQDADALQQLITALPAEVFAMFGLSDPSSMTEAPGFLSSRAYQSVGPILIVAFAVGAVSTLVAKEESSGLLDLVLSNPVPRRTVLRHKAQGIATLLGVITVVLTGLALIGNVVWDTRLAVSHIVAANVGLGLLGMAFAGIALAAWSLRSASSGRLVVAIAGVAWFANGLGAIVDVMAPLRRLSPFYWYLGDTAPLGKGIDPMYVALAVVAVAGSAIAMWRIETRDLAT